jgi:AcrR family transcriptional regulator
MARTVGSSADATRQQILAAARELFVQTGYAGTSIKDITERVGVTKGSVYYHFSSKEEILHALVSPLIEALEAFTADVTAAGGLDGDLVGRLVDLVHEHAGVLSSVFGDPSTVRSLAVRHQLPARIDALVRAIAGSGDPVALLRAHCVLGVIQAATMPPVAVDFEAVGIPAPRHGAPRLTADQREFTVAAARAILALPL